MRASFIGLMMARLIILVNTHRLLKKRKKNTQWCSVCGEYYPFILLDGKVRCIYCNARMR